MEVGISGIDAPNPVLAHQDGGVGVVYHVPSEVRELREYLGGDRGMPVRGEEDAQAGGGQQRLNEFPRARRWPGLPENSGMRRHPEEFVKNAPGQVPGRGLAAPVLEARMALAMERGICIGGVDEDVRVRDEH